MTEDELREFEKLLSDVSPEPWTVEVGDYSGDNWLIGSILCGNSGIDGEDYCVHITTDRVHGSELSGRSDAKTDAEFVARVRSFAPALIAEVRTQKKQISDLFDLVEGFLQTTIQMQAEVRRLRDGLMKIKTFKGDNPLVGQGDFNYILNIIDGLLKDGE